MGVQIRRPHIHGAARLPIVHIWAMEREEVMLAICLIEGRGGLPAFPLWFFISKGLEHCEEDPRNAIVETR